MFLEAIASLAVGVLIEIAFKEVIGGNYTKKSPRCYRLNGGWYQRAISTARVSLITTILIWPG